jgi:hypothetical protein
MTQKLKESIKEYYEKHNLSTTQLLQIQNIQKKLDSQFNRRRRFHTHWAIAAGAVVLLLWAFIFFNTTGHRKYMAELINEIAYNHNRNLEMEIKSNSLKEIASYLSQLDFSLIYPERLSQDNWEMIGGRYCTLKGQFAAQLKIRNKVDQKNYTLYQIEKPHDIKNIADLSEHFAKGVKVNLWGERGLIIALAGDDK